MSSSDMLTMFSSSDKVLGSPSDSGRAEISGITHCIEFLATLDTPQREFSIPYYCDSMESISFAKDLYFGRTPTWVDTRNIYLKIRLQDALSRMRIKVDFIYVKSHQDDRIPKEDLPLSARLNVICNKAARRPRFLSKAALPSSPK